MQRICQKDNSHLAGAQSAAEFVDTYYKRDRLHATPGKRERMIEHEEKCIAEYGSTLISHHDCKLGETVWWMGNRYTIDDMVYVPCISDNAQRVLGVLYVKDGYPHVVAGDCGELETLENVSPSVTMIKMAEFYGDEKDLYDGLLYYVAGPHGPGTVYNYVREDEISQKA